MRAKKKLSLMLAAAFALMPLPAMLDAQASPSHGGHTLQAVPTAAHVQVNRAGVAINGVMKSAIDPIRVGGMYYVPFKEIARILDYDDVRYNYSTKTYTATDGSATVKVTIGSSSALKGDEHVHVDPPKFINGTTYLSLGSVGAVFNTYTWFKAENGSIQVQLPARQYKVQAGDTLWEVAQAHHTTIAAVRAANNLTTDSLTPGQMLRVPPEYQTREMEPVRQSSPTPSQQNTATPVQSSAASAKAQAIISTGKKYMGRPYKFGAKPSEAPARMDCSSFLQYIFQQNGISLPRDSRQQSAVGTRVAKSDLQPGDLVFFKYPERYSDGRVGHVGMYIGNGQMLHTVPKTGVTISKMTSSYWTRNYLYGKRVIK
ncbi:peptidoglycan endopeptidase LytE [Tumebacillus sp. BK434]|uniref:C40 family peptidase n=1 Tax=Tumebacillus sp. BK434 TaxID=2512169 RepID=UPI00104AD2D5|nr:NlpC/P60 family protein [Tumebacillus sp. BK434]TCP52501.1 peptidoglycan endopeptidase LytE [Tumebacillus sp. BK434]